tara:strand:- start:281 stop:652 length:372 start_codon:yes stop_codon:yes gene_type:complete
MAHYALLNINNEVTSVFVGKDETEGNINWEIYYMNRTSQVCKRTSVNTLAGKHNLGGTPFRKNFAGIGFIYDESRDAFIEKKPHDSWVLNEESCVWEPPVKYPDDKNLYSWNEESQQWDLITE